MMLPLHGVGTRQDLPLPFSLVVIGSAITLLVTFALVLRSWREPRWQSPAGRPLPRFTRLVDHPLTLWAGRVVVAGLVAVALLALVAGPDRITNPFPGFLFVWVWVGLVQVSLLAGQVWRRLSVVRTVLTPWGGHRDASGAPLPGPGVYPAAVALLAFLWLELVQPDRATTAVLKWWVLAFAAWVLVGAAVRGVRWVGSAEPFEVFAQTMARLSPWQRRDVVVHVTNPLRHLVSVEAPRGLWAVCCVLLAGTAFDSLGAGLWWIRLTQASGAPGWLWGTAGLLGCLGVVAGSFTLGVHFVRGATRDSLARSLVPIVAGYALAHYATLLVLEGQRVAINLSDPLGRGDNWFGTAELGVNAVIFDYAGVVAWAQVVFIVGGHVLGVLAAHDIALRTMPRERQVAGQLPLLLVMVGYTVGGLLLLFG
ncbi:hypothetical protein ACQB6R_05825 [Propionibacteriaceae bacterium G1746]